MAKVKELVDFTVSEEDRKLINKIVYRADELGLAPSVLLSTMDLTATHARTPLRLKAFLEADVFNFRHDFCGIHNCINRATGTMKKNFVPRFTVDQAPSVQDEILGALITRCQNNEKHRKEARRIQELRKRQPGKTKKGPPQWRVDTHTLMGKLWIELEVAEPEFAGPLGHVTLPKEAAFLDALP